MLAMGSASDKYDLYIPVDKATLRATKATPKMHAGVAMGWEILD